MGEVDRRDALLKLGAAVAAAATGATAVSQIAEAASAKRVVTLEIRVPSNIQVQTKIINTGKTLEIPARIDKATKRTLKPILSRKVTFDLTTSKTKEFFSTTACCTACCVRG